MTPDLTGKAPLLVFGGPYSNLRAVAAMRALAGELGLPPERCICTGDVVAYCVEPEETVAAMRDWGCPVIAGNCEEQLAAGAADCGCGFEEGTECDRLAKDWYAFANERISPASRAWMAALPKTLTFTFGGLSFRVVHGGVDQINRFVFASQRADIADELERAQADVVVAGHAGIPFIERVGKRVWFNAGVIGMPANDGTPDVWYGLIRSEGGCGGALHASARLRSSRHGCHDAQLGPCQRLRALARHGTLAEPRRAAAGGARRHRPAPSFALAASAAAGQHRPARARGQRLAPGASIHSRFT